MTKPRATAVRRGRAAWLYWSLVALLIGFGIIAIFSLGLPFLIVGVALAILSPLRHRPASFWPALIGVFAFIVGFVVVAPLGCTAMSGPGGARTTCFSVLGRYSGGGGYNPSLWPAACAGLLLAGAAWAVARRLARRVA